VAKSEIVYVLLPTWLLSYSYIWDSFKLRLRVMKKTAIPTLIEDLDLNNSIISIDAIAN
jgi:hypothetical protein